jgi:methylated-DNA-protein-cysteine methyltransferase related protein
VSGGTGSGRDRIYGVVRRIPAGRVATYGDVARAAGMPGAARQVGYALHALPAATRVPWHRVVTVRGGIGVRDAGASIEQRFRLEREGVRFGPDGRLDLGVYGWSGS